MLQYLIIQLCDTSTSFCHYTNDKTKAKLISLSNLKLGIKFAMKQNLMIQFLYPDYDIPEEYKTVINSIDHSDIVASTCENETLRENADIVIFSDWTALEYYKFRKDSIYALRTSKDDLFDRYLWLKPIISKVYRLNIIITDIENFTTEDFNRYKQILHVLSNQLADVFNNNDSVQLNLLTDRIILNKMNNCNAGFSHLTLAPNGLLYICPAFYADKKTHQSKYPEYDFCLGEMCNDIHIPNESLYKLENSPLCRTCDAFQCRRCIWLNKKTTLEVNTPSHEQCVISHLERNCSKELLESIRKQHDSLSDIEIPPIDYLDPFDNRKEW